MSARHGARLAAALGAGLLAAAGCSPGSELREGPTPRSDAGEARAAPRERPAQRPQAREPDRPKQRLRTARCPAAGHGCASASGRIVYVERVDPDGDGDAHFVLASRKSVTAPGISVIDVAKELRPSPLPGPGDRISAAGPVYEGSYGQRQIQALRVNVAGRD